MKILLVVLMALSTSSGVYAQHPIWLDEAIRVDNPDELAYWIAVEAQCPLIEDELESLIQEVFVESRVKPLKDRIFEEGRVYLNVSLRCTRAAPDNRHAYSVSIHFGRYKPWPAILFDAPYVDVGIGDKDSISQNCKERLEAAVAAFKKANTITVGKRQAFDQG